MTAPEVTSGVVTGAIVHIFHLIVKSGGMTGVWHAFWYGNTVTDKKQTTKQDEKTNTVEQPTVANV